LESVAVRDSTRRKSSDVVSGMIPLSAPSASCERIKSKQTTRLNRPKATHSPSWNLSTGVSNTLLARRQDSQLLPLPVWPSTRWSANRQFSRARARTCEDAGVEPFKAVVQQFHPQIIVQGVLRCISRLVPRSSRPVRLVCITSAQLASGLARTSLKNSLDLPERCVGAREHELVLGI
jgi:hypothetical protein